MQPMHGPSRLQSAALKSKELMPAVRSKALSPMHVVLSLHVQHLLLLITRMHTYTPPIGKRQPAEAGLHADDGM